MNEDEVTITEPSTENIPASEGGETVTPEEVAQITGKKVNFVEESEDESDDEEQEEQEEQEESDGDIELEDDGNGGNDDETGNDSEEQDDTSSDELDSDLTDDQTFTLEVEDANGAKFTLKPGDDLEKALEDFEPKSNGQIMKVLNDFQRLESDKLKYEETKAASAAEKDRKAAIAKINQGWQNEVKALQGQKRLPVQSDGTQSDREKEVFKFMSEENDKREKDNRPLIRSFEDALDKLELKEIREKEKQAALEEKNNARKKGSIVGGSSAPVTSSAPTYRGNARTAAEASRQMGLR